MSCDVRYPAMVGRFWLCGLVLASACSAKLGGRVTDGGPPPVDSPVNNNTGSDAPAPGVDALPAWSTPAAVTGANSAALNIDDETLSSTQLEIYFGEIDTALTGNPKQLWMMSRAAITDAWGTPTMLGSAFNVPPIGSAAALTEESPRLANSDLTLYWGRNGNIFSATRASVTSAWVVQGAVTQVNTGSYGKWLAVCDNGYFMISRANGSNGQDFYEGQLGAGNGSGALVTELSSPQNDTSTFLSTDCMTTYFASSRSGTTQIYTATRPAVSSPWTTPTEVTTFGSSSDNEDPWMSDDQLTFYFASTRFGGTNTNKGVYTSTR